MKYYLGYYDNTELKAMELEGISTTILSVVKFTTNFDNLNSLKDHLLIENKIPNRNVSLCYTIEKGKKGHKYYEPLKTKRIYTIEFSSLFSVDGIKKFINEKKYDESMIVLLFSEYLRKYGFDSSISEYLKKLNIDQLIPILGNMSNRLSFPIKSKIDYLVLNYQRLSTREIQSHLEYIVDCLKYSNHDLLNVYLYLRSFIGFQNIPTLRYLTRWYNIAHDHNKIESECPSNSQGEYQGINTEIAAFLNTILYNHDSKKVQERQLFDLAVILDDYYKRLYDEYLNTIYKDDDSYDEDAEFLCEADFERIGTTSLETGIKIRKIHK